MDTRKVTLIATIAAIALVAVGIGYAYTASTLNSGNSANSEYITLVQDGDGAYKFSNDIKVDWNTADSKTSSIATTFTLNGAAAGGESAPMSGFYIKAIGNPITIKTQEQGMTSTPPATLTCAVAAGGTWNVFTGGDHPTTFFLKVENNGSTTWLKLESGVFKQYNTSEGTWTGSSDFSIAYKSGKDYYDTTVTVYYGIAGTSITVTHGEGAHPAGPSAKPLNEASLTFTVANP